jgi:hypothetical protein
MYNHYQNLNLDAEIFFMINQITAPTQTKAEFIADRDYSIWFQFKVLKIRQREIAKEHGLSVSRVKAIVKEQKEIRNEEN